MLKAKLIIFVTINIFTALLIISCGLQNNTSQQEQNTRNMNLQLNSPQRFPAPIPEIGNTGNYIIGSFQTELLDTNESRVNNIKLAAKELNGYILEPDRTFSFNTVLGARSSDKGYEKAKIIVDGHTDYGRGGGICQLSSTLYNAAKNAGMEIIERHSHSKETPYIEKGLDAAVSYGHQDFRFKNSMDYPIEIRTSIGNGKVVVYLIRKQ